MSTVIRSPNWIGDGIMALPAIRAYKERFPQERLAVAAKHYLADIFLNIPEIDEIISIPDRWTAANFVASLKEFRARKFNRGILFTNSFSSALFFFLAGVSSRCGYNRDGRGWLLDEKIPWKKNRAHHQFYYLDLIEHLTGEKIRKDIAAGLVVSQSENDWASSWLEEMGSGARPPFLAVAPAAAYGSAKAWLPDRFHQFIASWQKSFPECTILLLGGMAEKDRITDMVEGLAGRIINLAGRLTLRQTIIVLARCRLFVGNDSGLMHAAAALAVPLVAIFGPTEPGKTAPIAKTHRLLHHGADCAPCLHRECPTDHRCMSAVRSDEVLAAARQLWDPFHPGAK